MSDQKTVEVDASAVIAILQEQYPDAVTAAVWRVRAEKAEAALAAAEQAGTGAGAGEASA